jgi:phosphatidylserine decarboxylase
MSTPLRRGLSHAVGWLADRGIPTPLRAPVFRAYSRITGADPDEAELPLRGYPSLQAFFSRRLKRGARPVEEDPALLVSPCDGTVQEIRQIREGTILQAKGRPYRIAELIGDEESAAALEGGWAWTIYLSPRDYHRVHAPEAGELTDVRWLGHARYSVAPRVLARRDRVLAGNERAVLSMASSHGLYHLVMVGALNVGRIRVIGVEAGSRPAPGRRAEFARGAEFARFEMGSTVVLLFPPHTARPTGDLPPGRPLRLGEAIGRFEE